MLLCIHVMQEKEISEILSKNTELYVINSDLQKQLDEQSKVRVLLLNTITRNQKQCLLQGTAILAGPITCYLLSRENTLPFPTCTRCSENHNNTCAENWKSTV